MIVSNNVLKSVSLIGSVKILGHWITGRTSGSLVGPHNYWSGLYKNIYDQKLHDEWNFDTKKSCFFFLFKVRTLKKIIFTAASFLVNFLTAAQFKLIPIQIQISSYIKW